MIEEPFKIGDEVICNDPGYSFGVGTHGVIVKPLDGNLWIVRVVVSQVDESSCFRGSDSFCFRGSDLEHKTGESNDE